MTARFAPSLAYTYITLQKLSADKETTNLVLKHMMRVHGIYLIWCLTTDLSSLAISCGTSQLLENQSTFKFPPKPIVTGLQPDLKSETGPGTDSLLPDLQKCLILG